MAGMQIDVGVRVNKDTSIERIDQVIDDFAASRSYEIVSGGCGLGVRDAQLEHPRRRSTTIAKDARILRRRLKAAGFTVDYCNRATPW